MKKSDWALRDEKRRMMGAVTDIQRRFRRLDSLDFNLETDLRIIQAAIDKYSDALKKPLMRFFTGDVLELVMLEAHDEFMRSVKDYIKAGKIPRPDIQPDILLQSLKDQLTRNVDGLIAGTDESLKTRAVKIKEFSAQSVENAASAQLEMTQLKIESITERTTGADDLAKAWEELKSQYGTRETVRYRNGANYPLTSYLDGRANTTSSDIHRVTTQLDASASGVYTGKVSRHGATDSCRPWEGKILFFTSEGRDIMSRKFPEMRNWKTVEEVKNDPTTHMWKFHCRHIITPYPIQFFDDSENRALVKEMAA